MSTRKPYLAASVLYLGIGFVIVLVALILFTTNLESQLRTTTRHSMKSPTPSPSQLRPFCLDRCDNNLLGCNRGVNNDVEICEGLIFDDGNGNCYGPDGKLFDCDAPPQDHPCSKDIDYELLSCYEDFLHCEDDCLSE